jgi:hypothetical protein
MKEIVRFVVIKAKMRLRTSSYLAKIQDGNAAERMPKKTKRKQDQRE